MKTDLIRNSSFLLSSQLVVMGLSLLAQIIMARFLMPTGRGIYAVCIVFSLFSLLFTNFGNEYGVRFLFLKKRISISSSFFYLVFTTILSLIFSFIILKCFNSILIGNFSKEITSTQFICALIYTSTNFISRQTNVLLTISKEFKSAAFISIFEEFLKISILYSILVKFRTVESAFLSLAIGNIIIIMYYFFKLKLYDYKLSEFNFNYLKYIYSYGLRNFIFGFSSLANGHLGTLILSFYLTNEMIGIYSVAYGLISRLQFIPDTLNRLFVPIFDNEMKLPQNAMKIFSISLLLFFLIIITIVIVFGDWIVVFLFGQDYYYSGTLIKIFVVGFLFKILCKPIEAFYNEIIGKPGLMSIINGFSLLILAGLMIFMSNYFGIKGAAIATSLSMFISYLILFGFYLNKEKISFLFFYDFDYYFKVIGQYLKVPRRP